MAEANLNETVYRKPGECGGCSHFLEEGVFCPTNVALGVLGRIKHVVDGDNSLDDDNSARELVEQLPKLSEAATACGELLAKGSIAEPYVVTVDLSLTNFTAHFPAETIPA